MLEETDHTNTTDLVIASDQQNQAFTLTEMSSIDGAFTSSFVTCSYVSQPVSQEIVLNI